MSTATPKGSPHFAPRRNVLATTGTTMLVSPTTKLATALPPMIHPGRMGATNRRASVPFSRSASRLRTPNSTVKNRKNTAMPAA